MSEGVARTGSGWERRGYASFVRFLEALARGSAGGKLLRREGVVACVAPACPDRSLFNSVAYEDPAALEPALDALHEAYTEAGVSAWTVWVPEADRASTGPLAERGHRLDGAPREMLLDLEAVPPPDEEFEYQRDVDWRTVCAINDAAYSYPEGTHQRAYGRRSDPAIRGYGTGHRGWTAAALGTVLHDGDCMIYSAATLPEARGNRLASRLLHQALVDARAAGCESSTLQASAMGASLYRRIGYWDLGALEMWERREQAG